MDSANSLKVFNWALDKLTGVSTTTRHIKSPLLESLTEDAPFPLILKINKAIHLSEKEINIYKILPESANKYPDWVKGIASFDKDHHKKVKIDSKDIIVEKVVSEKLMTIISDNYIYEQLDYFQIDTEGYDYEILKMLDFNMLKPKIIKFEIVNLNELDFELSKKLLLNQGYYLIKEGNDMVAIDLKRIKLK